jgi:hypothetical protein
MNTHEIQEKTTELEKTITVIELCIDRLHESNTNTLQVAHTLELANNNLVLIKQRLDKIITSSIY